MFQLIIFESSHWLDRELGILFFERVRQETRNSLIRKASTVMFRIVSLDLFNVRFGMGNSSTVHNVIRARGITLYRILIFLCLSRVSGRYLFKGLVVGWMLGLDSERYFLIVYT